MVVTQRPWLNKGLGCNLISPINDLETMETEARTYTKANFKVCHKRYKNNSNGDDACPKQTEQIAKQTSNWKLKEDHTVRIGTKDMAAADHRTKPKKTVWKDTTKNGS